MNFKNKTLVFLLIALIFFVFQNSVAEAGFGISPASLKNKNLVPGSFYKQDIFLVQSEPNIDLNATVTVNVGKINGWIKIENGNNFVIPKGVQQFPMKISVTVPQDAAFGVYKGSITVNTSPVGQQVSGVSVTLGAVIAVDLEVTSAKFSAFSIQNFGIPDVAKGTPLKFVIKVKNDGNTENGPTKVGLKFFDKYHSEQLGEQEQVITEKVNSFEIKDISVEFPGNLDFDVGSYWADVKIYGGEDEIIIDSKIVFNVVNPPPPEKQKIEIPFCFKFSEISTWVYSFVAIVATIVLIILLRSIIRRRKKNNEPIK